MVHKLRLFDLQSKESVNDLFGREDSSFSVHPHEGLGLGLGSYTFGFGAVGPFGCSSEVVHFASSMRVGIQPLSLQMQPQGNYGLAALGLRRAFFFVPDGSGAIAHGICQAK